MKFILIAILMTNIFAGDEGGSGGVKINAQRIADFNEGGTAGGNGLVRNGDGSGGIRIDIKNHTLSEELFKKINDMNNKSSGNSGGVIHNITKSFLLEKINVNELKLTLNNKNTHTLSSDESKEFADQMIENEVINQTEYNKILDIID